MSLRFERSLSSYELMILSLVIFFYAADISSQYIFSGSLGAGVNMRGVDLKGRARAGFVNTGFVFDGF